jgi:hypothetical protein
MTPTNKRFESQVQGVAREKNGGVVDKQMFWDIVVALDSDSEARHIETMNMLAAQTQENAQRHADTAEALREELQTYRDTQAERCALLHRKVIEEELRAVTAREPRRATDPSDLSFGGVSIIPELSFSYKMAKWVLMAVVVVALGWGLPFWADSCAQQATHAPAPTATSTPIDNL